MKFSELQFSIWSYGTINMQCRWCHCIQKHKTLTLCI